MAIKYISPVTGLDFETSSDVSLGSLHLTKDFKNLNLLFNNPDFLLLEGKKAVDNFFRTPCIVTTTDRIQTFSLKSDIQEAIQLIDAIKVSRLNCIWFIKDNAINTTKSYLQNGSTIISYSEHSRNSNSKGMQESITLTALELKRLDNIFPKIQKLFFYHKSTSRKTTNFIGKFESRLQRAYMFLIIARTTQEVTLKINLYITLLESLFTSNNNEIKHQLAERVTLYISGDTNTKRNNFEVIKEAYNIRSSLTHGSRIKLSDAKIEEISTKIDEIIRQIFNRIIDGDSKVFLYPDTDSGKKNFEEYFRNLIFPEST